MAGGNKKKKKPAANPTRGFATTSLQSKSKIESAKEADSSNASLILTPDSTATPAIPDTTSGIPKNELLELSPEELERQLETSELQQYIDTHSARVKKDASRQVTRLQTDRRVLRGQADFLSVKQWLPEELLLQVLEYTATDRDSSNQSIKRQPSPSGDDLVAKIWSLRLVLLDLEISLARVSEVIAFILQLPAIDDSSGQTWGLPEALDWLALNCSIEELQEYDSAKRLGISSANHEAHNISPEPSEAGSENVAQKKDSPLQSENDRVLDPQPPEEIIVSDVESDLEPDELLSVYIRTKARLYEANPANEDFSMRKKKGGKPKTISGDSGQSISIGQRQLQQKLRKIESDVLFDQREADAQWAVKQIDLAQEAAQRKKLNLSNGHGTPARDASQQPVLPESETTKVGDEAERLGDEILRGFELLDDGEILGGMFDSLPGTSTPALHEGAGGQDENVTIRELGRVTGLTPRRILEETCRSRDAKCKIEVQQVSPTTYSCRHAVTVHWTKDQEILDCSYLKSISVRSRSRQLVVTMLREATPDVPQSEAYVTTAALFVVFSGSPKEEKAHLRLPPSYRDLWNEFLALKREHIDSADREVVKELRSLVEKQSSLKDDSDDEVVFNASSRRLNGAGSGTSTPATRPQTPNKSSTSPASQLLQDMWARKIATSSYQQMLLQRTSLPMFHSKEAAVETISKNQVTIVVGDTGSGKSTQLPQFLLENELANGRDCKIYCTQPRRISAISLAQRVSEELGESKGDPGTFRSLIGYAIRLESHTVLQTKLVYATVGIVLRMLENPNGLDDITHLVLDEVHERNIDTDFLLIVLQSLIIRRPELKVVLMSATVDAQKFSRYLNNAPIISVPGRTFPVTPLFLEDAIELTKHNIDDANGQIADNNDELDSNDEQATTAKQDLSSYSPKTRATLAKYDEYKIDYALIVKLLEVISYDATYQKFSQAVLVFVPGIQEIRQLNDMLLGHPTFRQGWQIHALHSTFSSEDQQAAFELPPPGLRKIVIATNIAETGITIPDITCVIDTGKHREMRFDERRQMSKLTQSFIARANAKQRRGRAGRVQEGICFHLFTKHRFEELMVDQQTPEMLRLSLQDLVMRVKICKLGDIADALSQALDPPSSKNVRRAIDALIEVGALTENEQLTTLGSQLAKLPLDAQLGKLILYGVTFRCLDTTLTVAAALGSKSPFVSPMHAKKQADSVRLGFKRGDSDILTLYNAYSTWRKICTTPGTSEYQFCNKNFLSVQNLGNIEDLKAQLLTSLIDAGFVNLPPTERAALMRVRPGFRHRNFVSLPEKYTSADNNDFVVSSVLAWSFYPKIIKQDGKGWRNIANNQSLALHPTSVNKHSLSPDVKYLSFYGIMQSSSKFTNAQETTPVTDFALVLLAGDAVFHMYAGVVVIDGNRLRFKVRDWKTMIVLKSLRSKVKEALGRQFKQPGRELGDRQRRWLELVERIFDHRNGREVAP